MCVRLGRFQENADVSANVETLEYGVENDLQKESATRGNGVAETAADPAANCHATLPKAFATVRKERLDATTKTTATHLGVYLLSPQMKFTSRLQTPTTLLSFY